MCASNDNCLGNYIQMRFHCMWDLQTWMNINNPSEITMGAVRCCNICSIIQGLWNSSRITLWSQHLNPCLCPIERNFSISTIPRVWDKQKFHDDLSNSFQKTLTSALWWLTKNTEIYCLGTRNVQRFVSLNVEIYHTPNENTDPLVAQVGKTWNHQNR